MTVAAGELTATYAGVTLGGGSARQILDVYTNEEDFVNAFTEIEFVTTVASDAALVTELSTLRTAFRTPRQDLVVSQNTGGGAVTILSRKHSDNTGLNTAPRIIMDKDDAQTGRSRHFIVRIEYELPADVTSTSFRRGTTITRIDTAARRKGVTLSGVYTANSTDGTTTALAQFLAQIDTSDAAFLTVISSTATWERVGQPQVEFFETNKTVKYTRVWREVNVAQSNSALEDPDIIDPHLEVSVETISPGDSVEGSMVLGAAPGGAPQAGGGGSTQVGQTVSMGSPTTTTNNPTGQGVKRPVILTVTYEADINFETDPELTSKWEEVIRPLIINYAEAYNGNLAGGALVLSREVPAFEVYENHVRAQIVFIAYSGSIVRLKISTRRMTQDGIVSYPITDKNPFSRYEFQGPASRNITIVEERDEIVSAGTTSLSYVNARPDILGGVSALLGNKYRRASGEPQAHVFAQGIAGGATVFIAYSIQTTVFEYRDLKSPSIANAGGVTGSTLT